MDVLDDGDSRYEIEHSIAKRKILCTADHKLALHAVRRCQLQHSLGGVYSYSYKIPLQITTEPTARTATDVKHSRIIPEATGLESLTPSTLLQPINQNVEPGRRTRMQHWGETLCISLTVRCCEAIPIFPP
jgi:hypothetical protein